MPYSMDAGRMGSERKGLMAFDYLIDGQMVFVGNGVYLGACS